MCAISTSHLNRNDDDDDDDNDDDDDDDEDDVIDDDSENSVWVSLQTLLSFPSNTFNTISVA